LSPFFLRGGLLPLPLLRKRLFISFRFSPSASYPSCCDKFSRTLTHLKDQDQILAPWEPFPVPFF